MPRPYVKLPAGAKTHLEGMAQSGLLSESTAARALGMPLSQFRAVIRDHLPSKEIWDNAMAIERDVLLDSLFEKAKAGDIKAAQTLLAVRHGLSEKAPTGQAERVSVVFNLSQAQSADDYIKTLKAVDGEA